MSPTKKSPPAANVASQLPGEFPFLAAIAADLLDENARLAYADWLEEQGDARAVFVRALSKAIRSLRKGMTLPDASMFPLAWTNMLGVPLLEGIIEFELAAVKDSVLRLARPIVTMTPHLVRREPARRGTSKLGGRPDLPAGMEWPRYSGGPLGFLGQIALADLDSTQIRERLPRDGLLSIFASFQKFERYSNVEPETNDTRVFYLPASAKLVARDAPKELKQTEADGVEDGLLPVCGVEFSETWDLPCEGDSVGAALAKDLKKFRGNRADALFDLRFKCNSFAHHLLGYSVHTRCLNDPSPGPEWVHLFCLGSGSTQGASVLEHLSVFVPEAELRAGQIAKAFGYVA